ncbi:MAG: hypothetical protein PF589_11540 [Gammaproteobacteria bacterium]|jgi:hypothetical protein|nr:hypothetical protein [Gammaproteobacteria bacterium]
MFNFVDIDGVKRLPVTNKGFDIVMGGFQDALQRFTGVKSIVRRDDDISHAKKNKVYE